MSMRQGEKEGNFLGCILFDFSCSFAKQFKVGQMTAICMIQEVTAAI